MREITLMLYWQKDLSSLIESLFDFCTKEKIEIIDSFFREEYVFDFKIKGNTNDYEKLKKKFGDSLSETNFAELGNKLDLTQNDFLEWQILINKCRKRKIDNVIIYKKFWELIKNITNISHLQYLLSFKLNDDIDQMLKDRISILSGKKGSFELYLDEIKNTKNLIDLLNKHKDGVYNLTNEDIDQIIDSLNESL